MEQIQQLTTQPDHVNTACAPHMEMTISPTSRQELLLEIAAIFRDDVVLRNEMYRVRRWHAYYKAPENRDTNGFGHTLNTLELAEQLTEVDVAKAFISMNQADDICITALIHDIGEIRLGNATYGGKSKEHESKEKLQFETILKRSFGRLTDSQKDKLRDLFQNVAFGDKKKDPMAKYFNMIEVTGYTKFGYEMFEERPANFEWEVLAWRILSYHLFRTDDEGNSVDIPAYCQWSPGNREFWSQRIHHLEWMVEHFSRINQDVWLATKYDKMDLPDRTKVRPIDFSRWPEVKRQITGS